MDLVISRNMTDLLRTPRAFSLILSLKGESATDRCFLSFNLLPTMIRVSSKHHLQIYSETTWHNLRIVYGPLNFTVNSKCQSLLGCIVIVVHDLCGQFKSSSKITNTLFSQEACKSLVSYTYAFYITNILGFKHLQSVCLTFVNI